MVLGVHVLTLFLYLGVYVLSTNPVPVLRLQFFLSLLFQSFQFGVVTKIEKYPLSMMYIISIPNYQHHPLTSHLQCCLTDICFTFIHLVGF